MAVRKGRRSVLIKKGPIEVMVTIRVYVRRRGERCEMVAAALGSEGRVIGGA